MCILRSSFVVGVFLPVVLVVNSAMAAGDAETVHFSVACDMQEEQTQELTSFLEGAHAKFFDFFAQSGFNLDVPTDKLNWVCFDSSSRFDNYISQTEKMDLSWLTSYYSAKTNRVAILLPPVRLNPRYVAYDANAAGNIMAAVTDSNTDHMLQIAHELAHQLAFNCGLQKRGVMYPLWVSEGLATALETQLCRHPSVDRGQQLTKMRNAGRLIPLEKFVSITRLPADTSMHKYVYAQSQALFCFLLKQYPNEFKIYLKNIHELNPGRRSDDTIRLEFIQVFGTISRLDKEWLAYTSSAYNGLITSAETAK